jgi:hypothetical protein
MGEERKERETKRERREREEIVYLCFIGYRYHWNIANTIWLGSSWHSSLTYI